MTDDAIDRETESFSSGSPSLDIALGKDFVLFRSRQSRSGVRILALY